MGEKMSREMKEVWIDGIRKSVIVFLGLLTAVIFGLGVSTTKVDNLRHTNGLAEDKFRESITFKDGVAYFNSDTDVELEIGNRGYLISISPTATDDEVSKSAVDGWFFGKSSYKVTARGEDYVRTYKELDESLGPIGVSDVSDFDITDYFYEDKIDLVVSSVLDLVMALLFNAMVMYVVFIKTAGNRLGDASRFDLYENTLIGMYVALLFALVVTGMGLWWLNLYLALLINMMLLIGVLKLTKFDDRVEGV